MGNGSPTAYLLWAILSCIYLVFLLLHLWNYDRFQCLRWDSGRQPGAFKRVMTYSYLGTVPLLVIFSIAITVIKFKEGFIITSNGVIMPRPYSHWDSANSRWILPLYFVLSVAWSLEHVTHLEELTFWVFLLNQGPGKREWFASWEFRVWTIGSFTTLTGMPTTVLSTRHNVDTCLAYIFLVGSLVGTTTTVCFFYVLARFPWFIRYVKKEGAEPDVVVRLATFYQLNRIRVLFRFLFTLPLLIIALDGLSGPYPIVGDPFALDFLLMVGGIGCFISSAITLLIFFPRSITRESGIQHNSDSPLVPYVTKLPPPHDDYDDYNQQHPFELQSTDNDITFSTTRYHDPLPYDYDYHHRHHQDGDMDMDMDPERYQYQYHTSSSTTKHIPSPKSTIATRSGQRMVRRLTSSGAFVVPEDQVRGRGDEEEGEQGDEDEYEDEDEGRRYSRRIPPSSSVQMQSSHLHPNHHQHQHQQQRQPGDTRRVAKGKRRREVVSGESFVSRGSGSLSEMSPGYESDTDSESVVHSRVFVPPTISPPPPSQEHEHEHRVQEIDHQEELTKREHQAQHHHHQQQQRQQKGSREGRPPSSADTVVWDREHYELSLADVPESTTVGGESVALVQVRNGTGAGVGTSSAVRAGADASASGVGVGVVAAEVTGELRKRRRRHSDGPFSFDENGRLVSPGVGPVRFGFGGLVIGVGSRSVSGRGKMRVREEQYQELEQEGGGEGGRGQTKIKQRVRERERAIERARVREESALHPYLIHFTSPIDLHDGRGVWLTRSERGQSRRPPV